MSAAENIYTTTASDNGAAPLAEYSFNAENGEPEGCEDAASYEEAAKQWGEHLRNGDIRFMQVWGPGDYTGRWMLIERHRNAVTAREVSR